MPIGPEILMIVDRLPVTYFKSMEVRSAGEARSKPQLLSPQQKPSTSLSHVHHKKPSG